MILEFLNKKQKDSILILPPSRILDFHARVKTPFVINAYPYSAYKDDPNEVPLDYVLLQPNQGMVDPVTNLKHGNMYAQVDAVYSAIKAMRHTTIEVRVWHSRGVEDEAGATPENTGLHNDNLLKRIEENLGIIYSYKQLGSALRIPKEPNRK
ncbi:glucan endo-1,3-beta-glucosidase 14-like [Hibiscus syriacus]|uniref:glucan endo-1,3-beta-glucosidase 14-like n=1 Tax=Hibiscus syriacus TaxID=106335 RepID=UPI0019244763|nr:glucan endo-1,3-beta-glucosidase 14-like [Hibiscus syriacus]